MTAKIIVEPMERSLPTNVNFRSDRIASFRFEDDVHRDVAEKPEMLAAYLGKLRAMQLADLDAQEAVLRARYDMQTVDKPGEREARIQAARQAQGLPTTNEVAQARANVANGGDFQTADKPIPSTPRQAPETKAQPASTRPVSGPPSYVTPDGKPFQAGSSLAAGQRKCSDQEHAAAKPMFISSVDYDSSLRIYGRALCQAHMAKVRAGRQA